MLTETHKSVCRFGLRICSQARQEDSWLLSLAPLFQTPLPSKRTIIKDTAKEDEPDGRHASQHDSAPLAPPDANARGVRLDRCPTAPALYRPARRKRLRRLDAPPRPDGLEHLPTSAPK